MICPQCQLPLREGALFCTRCGTRTEHGRASGAGPAQADPERTAEAGAHRVGVTEIEGDADALLGRVLDGKYEITGRLGAGGMGAVYRARRVHIGDEVAVKVLHTRFVGDETLLERFRREARAAAQLHHPNVVTIHDYGEASGPQGFAYIVMELVAGLSLRELLSREGRLGVPRAVSLMRDVCAGVAAAHRREIVHRDIKPDNIIVLPPDDDHDSERVKVVDFGIAKLRDMASDSTLTQAGAVVGTPFYMSPEQCRGEPLDARADVYSLGALLYEMLAGSPPFTAPSVTGVIAKHLTEPLPPLPRDLRAPPALEAAVTRALSKDREGRQRDAAEFAREIQSASSSTARPFAGAEGFLPTGSTPSQVVPVPVPRPAQPAPQAPPPRPQITTPPPPRPRSWLKIALALFVGALLVSGAVVAAWLTMPGAQSNRRVAVNARPSPVQVKTPPQRRTPTPTPTPTPEAPAPAAAEALREEVGATIEDWAEATSERDIDAHMAFYADTLETFYTKSGVPAAEVRAARERAF
ncbi:MAG TPA: serine/threonine-protein kinase, partial [Pyrinomonadaceae bacterium]|nr:serine/threonine-protein kinase [Pyrinomonadaceae bacterium]